MQFLYELCYIITIFGALLIFYSFFRDRKNKAIPLKKKESCNYAILIPARNESAVIEDLLKSIQVQTELKDTYVIVEKASDKTVRIAKKYGANVYIRNVKKDTKRKGYALDECVKDILKKKKKYDLYFIFDADNIIQPGFFEEMLKTYKEGYQIASGYRNIKNCENTIATCSGLTFTMINSIINEIKMKFNRQIIIMGTGYYIDGSLIEKWKGFPFHSLTEDYELTLYCAKNNISTYYNDAAVFYDEQPTDMKTSMKQRTRWIRGYFETRKDNLKDIKNDFSKSLGVTPIILMLIGLFSFITLSFIQFIYYFLLEDLLFKKYLFLLLLGFIIIYISLFAFTYIVIIRDIEKLYISGTQTIKALFFNPIFLLSYIPCAFKALTQKEITWDAIEHNKKMS